MIILLLVVNLFCFEKAMYKNFSVVKNEIIVKTDDEHFYEKLVDKEFVVEKVEKLSLKDYYKIKIQSNVKLEKNIQKIKKNPIIKHAEPNLILKSFGIIPNDPYYNSQYYLNKIQMPPTWELINLIPTYQTIVAVVDTGVDPQHPDLKDNLILGWDFINNDDNPYDDNGHGTHIAGIIGAVTDNNLGIAGINKKIKILAVKVLNQTGEGDAASVSNGIIYSATSSAKIINLSLGTLQPATTEIQLLKDAIDFVIDVSSCIVVGASGNDGKGEIAYPASYEKVISVGSVSSSDALSSFSNYGQGLDFVAPGEKIFSTYKNNSYLYQDGTSMSAAIVSGLVSILVSVRPTILKDEIINTLKNGADDINISGWDEETGFGRINAYSSVLYMLKGLQINLVEKAFTVPNPFIITGTNSVSFIVPKASGSAKKIKIFNFLGENIRELEGLEWDGRVDGGGTASTGLYFFVVELEKKNLTGKFTVIKK